MIKDDYQTADFNLVNPAPGTHFCCFYETKAELLDSVVPYLKAGLDNHEFCAWIVSSQITPSEAINALRETTPGIEQRIAAGDLEIIPHANWYLKNGAFSIGGTIEEWKRKLSQKLGAGYRNARITGDLTWAMGDVWKEFHEYEKAMDQEIRDLNISALCTYPLVKCKPDQVLEVVSSHHFLISERVGKLDVRANAGAPETESEYRRTSSSMDSTVARTLELTHANEELKKEIAERQHAEQELRKREAQLSDAQTLAHLGSWEWDKDADVGDWSDELYRIWGVKRENFSPSLDSVLALVHPDDRAGIKDAIANAIKEKRPYTLEHRIIRPDGVVRTLQSRGRPVVDENGIVTKLIGTGLDITDRKWTDEALREAEEKYRELFENAKDAIYVHDLHGRYTSVNRAAEALSGFSRDEILGKHFVDFVAPEYVEAVRTNLCRKLVTEGETSYEVEVIGKDGRRTPVEVSSRLIRKNNVAIGVQGTARDITERRRAEEALRGYSRRLIDAQEEERQRIARELHDQIGQILTAVQFNLHALQRICATTESMALIDDGIRVLDETLEQVRDMSLDLRPSLLDDLGLVPALRWYVGRLTCRTGLKPDVVTDLPHQDMRFAREVETACFRIAQEALTNILRHAHATRVLIHLALIEDKLSLVVNDNGIGFDANLRAPSAMTLGLQGMQERAVAVGGSFRIISRISIGTEVNASFPI